MYVKLTTKKRKGLQRSSGIFASAMREPPSILKKRDLARKEFPPDLPTGRRTDVGVFSVLVTAYSYLYILLKTG